MIEMSRETISLTETNQSLQEELAEAKRTGQTDVEDLRSEFTRRLATAEKKFQAVVKVRVHIASVCFVYIYIAFMYTVARLYILDSTCTCTVHCKFKPTIHVHVHTCIPMFKLVHEDNTYSLLNYEASEPMSLYSCIISAIYPGEGQSEEAPAGTAR